MKVLHSHGWRSVTVGMTFGLVSLLGSTSAEADKTEPILAHIFDRDHIFHKVSERFMKRLDELSDGNFDVRYHPGGDLGGWTQITEQVSQGQIDMTMTWNHSELDRRWDIAALGFLADDWDSAKAVYGTDSRVTDMYEDILSGLNMELLGTIPIGFRGFIVGEDVAVPTDFPEDAEGFKIRTPGWQMAIKRYEALGFSPVSMPFGDLHTALQTGTVDGAAYQPPQQIPLFADVIDAYVYTREDFEHTFWLANQDWLNSLSAQERKWVRTAAEEATQWSWKVAERETEEWLKKTKEEGVEIVRLSEDEREQYRKLVTGAERPFIEKIVGAEALDEIEKAAKSAADE